MRVQNTKTEHYIHSIITITITIIITMITIMINNIISLTYPFNASALRCEK